MLQAFVQVKNSFYKLDMLFSTDGNNKEEIKQHCLSHFESMKVLMKEHLLNSNDPKLQIELELKKVIKQREEALERVETMKLQLENALIKLDKYEGL